MVKFCGTPFPQISAAALGIDKISGDESQVQNVEHNPKLQCRKVAYMLHILKRLMLLVVALNWTVLNLNVHSTTLLFDNDYYSLLFFKWIIYIDSFRSLLYLLNMVMFFPQLCWFTKGSILDFLYWTPGRGFSSSIIFINSRMMKWC